MCQVLKQKMHHVLTQLKQFQSIVMQYINQYKQIYEVLYTFTTNRSYSYLLNIEPSNFESWETYNTEFDEIIITFTDQNG